MEWGTGVNAPHPCLGAQLPHLHLHLLLFKLMWHLKTVETICCSVCNKGHTDEANVAYLGLAQEWSLFLESGED